MRFRSVLALALTSLSVGCFVSFDGYELADGTAGSGTAGASSGSAGASSGASGVAGASGTAGKAGAPAGMSGAAGSEGGAAGSGAAGASSGSGGLGGSSGAAGTTSGAAGTTSGAAGTTSGAGGTTSGAAGTTGGAAGTTAGAAGDAGMAGVAGAGGSDAGMAGAGGSDAGMAGTAGTGGTTAGASGSAGSSGGTLDCPINLSGPALIKVPKADATGHYCVDATEITMAQYQEFLDAGLAVDKSGVCAFNAGYAPAADGANCGNPDFDPVNAGNYPVKCVDWCDARDYCKWAGKHLCGAIGGGANSPADFADPNKDEWFNACSKNGARTYAWGNTYTMADWSTCAGVNNTTAVTPIPTQLTPKCVGGFPGLKDMSGNVDEWVDACAAQSGGTDNCLVRGGNVYSDGNNPPSLACHSGSASSSSGSPSFRKRQVRHELTGFRCCY